MTSEVRYAIGDLARLADVSRRTVRYYVQEGLIPPPLGLGRGNHYTAAHLDKLLLVKSLQEAGRSLDDIRQDQRPRRAARSAPADVRDDLSLDRSLWRRVTLLPGVELHVAGNVRLPLPGRLHELASWCRQHMAPQTSKDEADDE
jgi:DNA-binding transcriptional MerR regulator